jgi:uncharacterized membrane protein YcaP (DUF421 family)
MMNHALIFANFIVCACIMWSCLCRMRLTTHETALSYRIALVGISVLAMASAFQGPLFAAHVDPWEVFTAVAVWLALTFGSWIRSQLQQE